MAIWDDISVEVHNGSVPVEFSVVQLCYKPVEGKYQLNGRNYARETITTSLSNYCQNPSGYWVTKGQIARFRRMRRGVYSLLEDNPRLDDSRVLVASSFGDDESGSRFDVRDVAEDKSSFSVSCNEFIDWFTNALNDFDKFDHGWTTRSGRHKSGYPLGTRWSCTSIYSAYQQYKWPAKVENEKFGWSGVDLSETTAYLYKLKNEINRAIDEGDGDLAREACKCVLRWGGVEQRPNIAAAIKNEIPVRQLTEHLVDIRNQLNRVVDKGFSDSDLVFCDRNGSPMRVDSGTTKIFSLLCDSLIMYDGRVASAMAMLVLRWWGSMNSEQQAEKYSGEIPRELRFSFDANIARRRPGLAGVEVMRGLVVGSLRTKENIRVSWLIDEALHRDKLKGSDGSNFSTIQDRSRLSRSVESALFMMGYSLNG